MCIRDRHLESVVARAEIYSSKVYKLTLMDGKVIYKAKGMPIKQNDDMTPEQCELRWLHFTGGLRGMELPKAVKVGIRGFLTDISKGSVEPKSFELKRQMLNGDLKRNHLKDGDSEALWYSNLQAANQSK
jgi:hypothetical protein